MQKTIVIMRHAKAKRPSEDCPDFDRTLSEAGRRSIAATLPKSLRLWDEGINRVSIWTSPSARTRETAELAAQALKRIDVKTKDGIELVDCLWEGDEEAFETALQESDAQAIFVVGHNPFIETWIQGKTRSSIRFAPGAMACISYDADVAAENEATSSTDETLGDHRLLWFAQGPVSQRWKTLVILEDVIGSAVEAVRERRDSFFDDPDDIETMHKLRVSIRTLRSLVAFVKPWQDAKQNIQANSDLRNVVAATSHLRELDVLTEQARAKGDNAGELVAFCEEQAACERTTTMKALSGKSLQKKLERACNELHSIKWKARYREEGLEAIKVREHFDAMTQQLAEELEALDYAEVEKTHDVRKEAKRVRYCAEKFNGVLGNDAVGIAKAMTKHQNNLGAICDARVNIDIINGFSLNELPEPIAWDLALLRAENETFLYSTLRESR